MEDGEEASPDAGAENGRGSDGCLVGLPLPNREAQRGNLCSSEMVCIFLSGVGSYCPSHKDGSGDVIVWEAGGRVGSAPGRCVCRDSSAVFKPQAAVSRGP